MNERTKGKKKNYQRKNSKNSKRPSAPRGSSQSSKSEQKEITQVISKILKSSALNVPLRTDVISETNHYTMAAIPMAVVIDEGFITDALVDDLVQQIIDTKASRLGYASNVTAGDVQDYLVAAAKAYADYLVLRRAENTADVKDYKGNSLSELFRNVRAVGYEAFSNPMDSELFTPESCHTATINKILWERSYINLVAQLRLPAKLKLLIEYLFNGTFLNPFTLGSSHIVLYPSSVFNSGDVTLVTSAFNTDYATAKSLLTANPDMIAMLDELDIKPFEFNRERDQAGVTVETSLDMDFLEILVNTLPEYFLEITSSDYEGYFLQTYYTFEAKSNSFTPASMHTVDSAKVKLASALRGKVHTGLAIMAQQDGDIEYHYILPPGTLSIIDVTTAAQSLAAEILVNMTWHHEQSFNLPSPVYASYTIGGTGTLAVAVSASRYYDAYRGHFIGENFDVLGDMCSAELMFGEEYYSDLTNKLRALMQVTPIK